MLLEAVQLYEYTLEVEIVVSDVALIEQLRDAVENISFPLRLSNTTNITQIDIIFTGKNLILCPLISMWCKNDPSLHVLHSSAVGRHTNMSI